MRATRWLARGSRRRFSAALAVVLACALTAAFLARRITDQREHTVWVLLDPAVSHDMAAAPVQGPEALARRSTAGIALTATDYPLREDLVRKLEQAGARIRYRSRYLSAVSIDATAGTLRSIRRLEFVRGFAPVGTLIPTSTQHSALSTQHSALNDSTFYGPNYPLLARLGIPAAHELGLTGAGVRIAILDTGFEPRHEALIDRLVGAKFDFINRDTIVANEPGELLISDQERHGTWVWSLLGGFSPGNIVGPAYNATFLLAKVDLEPGDSRLDEDRWVAGVEWADSAGARIISSSSTFRFEFTDGRAIAFSDLNGDITQTTIAADVAARHGILVVQSIGNTLPADGSLAAPADADSIIAVGAVGLNGQPIDLGGTTSARGPTADGRTKPELVAPAENVVAANSVTLVGYDRSLGGTSLATPLIAGSAALFMEAWPNLNAMAVRRALLLSGSNARAPNIRIGWGLPDLGAAIMMPEGIATSSVTPRDAGGNLQSLAPVFSWNAPLIASIVRPVTYVVELATDSLMQRVVLADTATEAASLTLDRTLTPGTTFWWRVTAIGRTGTRRVSDVAGPFRMPHYVTQTALAGDQPTFTNLIRPTLTWTALVAPPPLGPLTYDVDVLLNSTGEVVQHVRNLAATSLTLSSPLTPNVAYRWRVVARTATGVVDSVTSVQPFVVNSSEAPPATLLYQNFPNPFPRWDLGSTSTSIWFDIAERSAVELSVHDTRGRLIRNLIPARSGCGVVILEPGVYGRSGQNLPDPACAVTKWDGTDEAGEKVPAGVYVLRLIAAGKAQYRRMLYQPN